MYTAPSSRPPAPASRSPLAATQRTAAFRRSFADFAAIVLLLFVLVFLIMAAGYHFWHTNRIFSGVNVAGVPVGGETRALAFAQLQQELGTYPLPPVNLTYAGVQYAIDPLEVRARVDLLDAVNQAYLVGRSGKIGDRIILQVQSLFGGTTVTPRRIYSTELLREAIAGVAGQVNRSGSAATQVGVISTRAQSALAVDEAATLTRLTAALDRAPAGQPLTLALVVTESQPDPATAPMSKPKDAPLFERPLILRSNNDAGGAPVELALDPAALSSMIVSTNPVQANEGRLREWLEQMASQIDLPSRDARLRFNPSTGGVSILQESLVGRTLDIEATVAAVQQALATGNEQAALIISEAPPAVDSRRVAEMGIRELVVSGSTYFAGSSADRIKNIEVAASKFDGVVIPPDGIFSFNRIVEDVSAANGFEDSLVIWGDRTAVGVGGGVCQVSTTIFRAAYEGGFPIVERYNHGYVVDWYGEPGLDATIFTPSVDFKFRNDTGAYLLVQPSVDAANGVITFNLYGTSPGRSVTVSEPQISDVKKPEAPSYTVDPTLASGQQKQVEWQKDGMTVVVQRTIVENGTTRTDTLKSVYSPWQAVFLVAPDSPLASTEGNTP